MQEIRNIAIIAHVDHGKTTLVDGMLKQTHTFRDNEAQMSQTTIMDSNELERERGITILAKNTAVFYGGVKINIIDTPGHADFGGEVERTINMADGALLIVDAGEGPLPQTKFVLQRALADHLRPIVVINKIDKKDARPQEVLHQTEELFLKLATHDSHLTFPVVYAIGRQGRAGINPTNLAADLTPLFELIISEIPNAVKDLDKPLQMQISTLDFDSHLGKLGIGKINRGRLKVGQLVTLVGQGDFKIEKIFVSQGLQRKSVDEAVSGEIVTISGINNLAIGQTLADPGFPEALPPITVSEPTLKVIMGSNTSPFAGRDGKFVTSRQIWDRLLREKETNLGLKIEEIGGGTFSVVGRGELHLAILLETMRREGYEMQISQPEVIIKNNQEPYEEVTIDVPDEYTGAVTTEMGKRRAVMIDMHADGRGTTRVVFEISQRNLIGARNMLLTATRGTMLFNTLPLGYKNLSTTVKKLRNGALVANDTGKSLAYSLENIQERGVTFVEAGEDIYAGMIIGLNSRENDMEINVCKDKQLTNVRASNKDIKLVLTPAVKMSLEQALDFVESDELIEITPQHLRLRKKMLTKLDRIRSARKQTSN